MHMPAYIDRPHTHTYQSYLHSFRPHIAYKVNQLMICFLTFIISKCENKNEEDDLTGGAYWLVGRTHEIYYKF